MWRWKERKSHKLLHGSLLCRHASNCIRKAQSDNEHDTSILCNNKPKSGTSSAFLGNSDYSICFRIDRFTDTINRIVIFQELSEESRSFRSVERSQVEVDLTCTKSEAEIT